MVSQNKLRRNDPPEVKRRRILDAARRVLIEKGYQSALLDDVAKEADVAKGTLYLYFEDKESLVQAVYSDMLDRLDEKLPLPGQMPAKEALLKAVEESLAFLDDQSDFISRVSNPGLCGGGLRKRFQQHVQRLGALAAAAMKEGVMRKSDPELCATVMMSLSRGFLMRKLHNEDKRPLRSQAPAVLELLLKGLGK